MKKKIILSLVVTLMLVAAIRPAPAQAGDIFKFSGLNANAFFFSQEGDCVATFVGVFANDGKFQSPPGSPGEGIFADVFIDRFDFCTETSLLSAFGSTMLDNSAFSINQHLSSASLNTSIEVFDFVTETSFAVDVNVNWTGTGDLIRQSSSFKSITPNCKFMDSFRGTFRGAEASGVVSDGITNFTPEPTSDASLSNTRSGTLVVGCN
ncbi:MAG TPA: hypothetical protein VI776_15840 [Anaerolineales bacterium]|nr:hypothetical protein [Anaerolineales bacterium]